MFAANVEADRERAVLRLAGEFDLSNLEAAQAALSRALGRSPSGSVLIDMRQLVFIDSTGIAFLVRASQQHGSKLTFRESDAPAVRRILGFVGMDRYFTTEGDD